MIAHRLRRAGGWTWQVPKRLEPGIYSIVKQGIAIAGEPGQHEERTWTVSFELLP